MMAELFGNYSGLIVFLHVFAAIVWVGGMIAIRFAVHPAMQNIDESKIKLARTLELLRNFFNMVILMIIILIVTAVIMALGLNFKEGDPHLYKLVHAKEGVWLVMTVVFGVIFYRRNKAEQRFVSGDLEGAKAMLAPIAAYLIPLNIVLGLAALYMGVTLRGF